MSVRFGNFPEPVGAGYPEKSAFNIDNRLDPQQTSTYNGPSFRVQDQADTKEKKKGTKRDKKEEKDPRKKKQKRLQRLKVESSMDMSDFVSLANDSINNLEVLIDRMDGVNKLIPDEPVQLRGEDAVRLNEFLGKTDGVITKADAQCLLKLANHSDIATVYDDALADTTPALNVEGTFRDLFSDARTDQAFPDFGIKLILIIIIMAAKFIVLEIFKVLCKMISPWPVVGELAEKGLDKAGANVYGVFERILAKIMASRKGKNRFGEKVWYIPEPEKSLRFPDLNPAVYKSCEGAPMDLQTEFNEKYKDHVQKILDEFIDENGFPINDGLNKCDPGYRPSFNESLAAQNLLEVAIKQEQNQVDNRIIDEDEVDPNKSDITNMISEMTMIDRMKSDAIQFVSTSKGLVKKAVPTDNFFIHDKAEAGMLGFMAAVNGLAQKMDSKLTGILTLRLLPEDMKEWMCCIVRFMYLILPRIAMFARYSGTSPSEAREAGIKYINERSSIIQERLFNGEAISTIIGELLEQDEIADAETRREAVAYGRSDAFVGLLKTRAFLQGGFTGRFDLDSEESMQNAKEWIIMIDSIIGLMLGSVSINFNLNFNFSRMFLDILEKALAEAGSILATALYTKIKEGFLKVFTKMEQELPDVSLAMELCPPFKWGINLIACTIEGLFSKLQNVLANIWSSANASLNDIDFNLTVTATNKSFNFLA